MRRSNLSWIDILLTQIGSKLNQQLTQFKNIIFLNIRLNKKLHILVHMLKNNIELILILNNLVDGWKIFYFRILHSCKIFIFENLLPSCYFVQFFYYYAFTGALLFSFEVYASFSLDYFIKYPILIHSIKLSQLCTLYNFTFYNNYQCNSPHKHSYHTITHQNIK